MNFIIYFLTLISLLTLEINAYHDELLINERDMYNRFDPDSTLYGFFPFWGVVLFLLAGFFLVIAALGIIGYLVGLQSPVESRHPSTDSTAPFFVIQNFATTI